MMTAGQTEDKITLQRVRRLRRSGNSSVLTIPKDMLEVTHFSEGDDVELAAEANGDEIVIRPSTDAEK